MLYAFQSSKNPSATAQSPLTPRQLQPLTHLLGWLAVSGQDATFGGGGGGSRIWNKAEGEGEGKSWEQEPDCQLEQSTH